MIRSPRTIIDIDQPFSIPEEDKAYANYIKKAYSQAAQKAQADPSLQDWYEQTEANRRANKLPGTSFETFQALQTHTIQRPYLRGGKPISSGNIHTDSLDTSEGTVEEIIPDDSLTTQLDDFANQDKLKTDIPPLLASMSQRNRDIVLKHSSADDYSTQKNLSEVYDVSPSRISQIYNYQTDVMRRKLKKMGYTRNVIPD
jgi:hypothetical protein